MILRVQVIFLKDGSRLELLGVENHQKLKGFVEGYVVCDAAVW